MQAYQNHYAAAKLNCYKGWLGVAITNSLVYALYVSMQGGSEFTNDPGPSAAGVADLITQAWELANTPPSTADTTLPPNFYESLGSVLEDYAHAAEVPCAEKILSDFGLGGHDAYILLLGMQLHAASSPAPEVVETVYEPMHESHLGTALDDLNVDLLRRGLAEIYLQTIHELDAEATAVRFEGDWLEATLATPGLKGVHELVANYTRHPNHYFKLMQTPPVNAWVQATSLGARVTLTLLHHAAEIERRNIQAMDAHFNQALPPDQTPL